MVPVQLVGLTKAYQQFNINKGCFFYWAAFILIIMKIKSYKFIYLYLIIWILVNTLFLTGYPFVHSDEPWLSGLSRSMISNESLNSTEDFFDLYERNPHAIKIIFHIIQIIFIKIFGYSIFTVRFISLIAGGLSLLFLYKLIIKLFDREHSWVIALLTVIWLSFDVQFLYISHLARQEIILILSTILMLNIVIDKNLKAIPRGIFTGLILGLSVGIHPNSFIIAWPVGLYFLFKILKGEKRISEGVCFLLTTCLITGIFIFFSFHFNSNFIDDYGAYGEPLGVLDSTDVKLLKLPGFYYKLFNNISGTYHNSNIKMQMILFPIFLLVGLLKKRSNTVFIAVIGFVGFNVGLLIIGKYSQPSISLILPYYYLLSAVIIEFVLNNRNRKILIPVLSLLIILSLYVSISDIRQEKDSYAGYINKISSYIPKHSIVLSNLNHDYMLPRGRNYDWRNLHYLKENNLSLKKYIEDRGIEYIIVPEELSYIYKNRPYWNVIYGNLSYWYPELMDFTKESCLLVGEFGSPAYGMRIVALRYKKPWNVKIYRVDQIESINE